MPCLVSPDSVGRTITCSPCLLKAPSAWTRPHCESLIPVGRSRGGHVHTYWWAGLSATCRLVRTISISQETRRQHMFSLRPSASPITPPSHTFRTHILTYLLPSRVHTGIGVHVHTHSKTPHRTRDCSKTTLYSCEEAAALSVCASHMNTK